MTDACGAELNHSRRRLAHPGCVVSRAVSAAAAAPQAEAPADAKKKGKKKKGKAAAQQEEEEDIDALLAELEAGPATAQPASSSADKPLTAALTQSTAAAVEAAEDAGLSPRPAADDADEAATDEAAGPKVREVLGGLAALMLLSWCRG